MSDKGRDIDTKNRTYYFFNVIIKIKIFEPNKTKIDVNKNKIFLFATLDM